MGGGASSQKLNEVDETIQEQHLNSHLEDAVEEFAEQCYIDGDKKDGLHLILNNTRGRKAFLKFLNSENGAENLKFFEDMEQMRKVKDMNDTDVSVEAQKIIDSYNKPDVSGTQDQTVLVDNVTKSIDDVMPNSLTLPGLPDASTQAATAGEAFLANMNSVSSNETIVFMAFNVFPKFVGSQAYKDWREEESKITGQKSTVFKAEKKQKLKKDDLIAKPDALIPNDSLAAGTMNYIDPSKISSIFRYGSWLGAYVAAAEGLPICVTLADAKMPGFPLIYVNNVFEATTLFKREKIRNTNCRFLQGPKTEQSSIDLLSAALANGQPIKVAITNYRQDGTMFKNLLAMKPVFDLDGNYVYVCGVQFDITNPGSNAKAMKLVDCLMNLLPNVVPVGSGEPNEAA